MDLAVWVSPRASRSEVIGVVDGWLRLRLAAPPHDGRANAALTRYIADLMDVASGDVYLRSGGAARRKMLRVRGVTLGDARRLLGLERG